MIDPNAKFWIYGIYVLAMVIWTLICIKAELFSEPGFFLIFIPYIVFIINLFNVGTLDVVDEGTFFTGTFLSIGLVVMVAILGWFRNMGDLTKKEISLLLLSLGLALFSHIELGIPVKYVSIYRHYRSILQTFSIVLFLTVLVNYFYDSDDIEDDVNKNKSEEPILINIF